MFIVAVICIQCTYVYACVSFYFIFFVFFFFGPIYDSICVCIFDGMCSSFRHCFNSIYGALFRLVSCLCGDGGGIAANTNEQTNIQTFAYTNTITDDWRWIGAASNDHLYKHYELNFKAKEVVISHHITFRWNGHPISIARIIICVCVCVHFKPKTVDRIFSVAHDRASMHFSP